MTTTYIKIDGDRRDTSSLTVPTDRIFRGAWVFNGDVIEEDMVKAKEIHKDNLRAERKPLLEALDVEYMKALESGSGAAEIALQKGTLRDVTDDSRIESAENPEDLKALTLETLIG